MIIFKVMKDLDLVYEWGQWRLDTDSDEKLLEDDEAEFIASNLLPSSQKSAYNSLKLRGEFE